MATPPGLPPTHQGCATAPSPSRATGLPIGRGVRTVTGQDGPGWLQDPMMRGLCRARAVSRDEPYTDLQAPGLILCGGWN